MTQYLLSVHGSDEDYAEIDPAAVQEMYAAVGVFNDKVREAGIWVFAGGLESASTATVVDGCGVRRFVAVFCDRWMAAQVPMTRVLAAVSMTSAVTVVRSFIFMMRLTCAKSRPMRRKFPAVRRATAAMA